MKIRFVVTLSFALVAASASVLAHDPSTHQNDAAPPACAEMKDMDLSKIEPNDPVLKAMQLQCHDATAEDEDPESHGHAMTMGRPGTTTPATTDAAKP